MPVPPDCFRCPDFNSRTHVECDPNENDLLNRQAHFNSRTHVECDADRQSARLCARYFNSRTHVECDGISLTLMAVTAISTHALTWSATKMALLLQQKWKYFNSRTHVECDLREPVIGPLRSNFNSRTHVECDSKYCIKKRFATQYMGSHCFLSSIILIFFIYSKK